ncbi:MAG TPA: Holliday junction resolvase RuvX [Chlamydiales bacterium]|nr:Holliday junction resolvase RuvX [Chlamydiales bacterium]
MGRILAIDYGKARIGLAITDENQIMALPLKVIKALPSHLHTIEAILNEVSSYLPTITTIIIGLPLHLDGRESDMSQTVRQFASLFEQKTDIPIHLIDERLTSKVAERSLMEIKQNRKKRSQSIDAVAASIFLQNYLDRKGNLA